MNIKRLLTIILTVFITVSIGYLIYSETGAPGKEAVTSSVKKDTALSGTKENTLKAGSRIVIYYFHTTRRCFSCKKIEALTRKAIDENFRIEIEKQLLEIRSINVDFPENKHFIDEFKLSSKSVVLVKLNNNKITQQRLLPKIWELLQNDTDFIRYIISETRAFIKENT